MKSYRSEASSLLRTITEVPVLVTESQMLYLKVELKSSRSSSQSLKWDGLWRCE